MSAKSPIHSWTRCLLRNATTGRQIFWRYAKDLRPSFDRSAQPHRIIIVWKYASECGQPGPTDHDGMNSFEDALAGALKERHVATLALVSTGENLREWTYYAQSEDSFIERFDEAVADLALLPIEIHTAHDPTWRMYTEFRTNNPNT